MKLTVRLGKPGKATNSLLKSDHGLNGPITGWDNINGAELYFGQAYENSPDWKSFLEDGCDENLDTLVNQGAAAVLFVPVSETPLQYLIYIFGYGFSCLNFGYTEWDFGVKVVLNSISRRSIKSVDTRTIGIRGKNKRVQLPVHGEIGEFDVDVMQDIVNHIAGTSVDDSFAKSLSGGESLSLSCDLDGSSLFKKSKEIINQYKLDSYKADFGWIDFISPVKDHDLITHLDHKLRNEINLILGGNTNESCMLSFPSVIDYDSFDYLSFRGYGSYREFDHLDFNSFIIDYQSICGTELGHDLNKISIDLFDGTGARKSSFPFYKSLSAEVEYSDISYVLTTGIWYILDSNHYNKVSTFFERLLSSEEFAEGETTIEKNEPEYLKTISGGYEVLDRDLFRAYGNTNTIEYADIISEHGEMIHVKDGKSSSKLSHLFTQGLISARLLLNDINFRKELKKTITSVEIRKCIKLRQFRSGDLIIVFRILRKGSSFNIPFLSKLLLYDTYNKIKAMGFKFRLEWVRYS